ncbi:MAG: molybdate ABC transporter substrate-binding protein [Pseudomonadales bacterium]|nr:molybdate ABC transporter substrate-binding protein [Pseudomonadales bacterium]
MHVLRLITFNLLLSLCLPLHSETVTLAVASNFKHTALQLKKSFEETHTHRIRLVSASSGKLYAQILQKAPFDIFLSADQHKPQRLQQQGLIADKRRFTYAIGQLVLFSADKELDVKHCLMQGCYKKLALANAQHAPYGVAAEQTLKNLTLKKSTNKRLIRAENINQSLQFILSKNVELGFIAASQLKQIKPLPAPDSKNIWQVAESLYPPILQDAVLLKTAETNPAALALWDFLQSSAAQGIIKAASYHIPSADTGQ